MLAIHISPGVTTISSIPKRKIRLGNLNFPFTVFIFCCFLLGLFTSFEIGLAFIVFTALLLTIWNLRTNAVLVFLLPLLCVDPVSKIFLDEFGIRFHTMNYLLSLLTLYAILSGKVRLKPLGPYLALLLWLLFGLIYSDDRFNGFINIWSFLSFLAFYLTLSRIFHKHFGEVYVQIALWNGLVTSLLVSLLFYLKYGFEYFSLSTYNIYIFNYVNPNTFVHLPVMGMICSFLIRLQSDNFRGYHLVLQFLFLLFLGLAGSRGGLLLGLVIFSVTFFSPRNIKWAIFTLFAVGFLATKNVDLLKNSGIYGLERVSLFFDEKKNLESAASGRTEIGRVGFEIMKQGPLFGAGTGAFNVAFGKFTSDNPGFSKFLEKSAGARMQAHSQFIKTMAENGLIGIIILVIFIYSIFLSRNYSNIAIVAVIILLTSFTFSEFSAKTPMFLAAFSMAQSRYFQWAKKI